MYPLLSFTYTTPGTTNVRNCKSKKDWVATTVPDGNVRTMKNNARKSKLRNVKALAVGTQLHK